MGTKFLFHSDAGHGWLAVPRSMVKQLGIADNITQFSYANGATIYLEEDCDAPRFIEAYKEFYKMEPSITELSSQNRSPIRNYRRFNKEELV